LHRDFDAPDEAYEILKLWDETLYQLELLQATGEAPASLIGSVDWLTKQHLLEEAGTDVSQQARKKIDICYHELSPLGYFQMLQAADLAVSLVDVEEAERAIRTPPAGTPATMRGHYMREFSSDATELTVNWKKIVMTSRSGTKTIRLDRYGRHTGSDSNKRQENARR
jgi:hypothetical protein